MQVHFPEGTKAIPVSDLVPYARNARTHTEEQVRQIASSIVRFGFNNPVLIDGDNNVIAGHGRIMAAESLGLSEVPALVLDHLSDTERKAFILADNQIALNAGWDTDMLAQELAGIRLSGGELDGLGFDDQQVEDLLSGLDDPADFLNDMATPAPAPSDPGAGAAGGAATGSGEGAASPSASGTGGGRDQGGATGKKGAVAAPASAPGGVALVLTMSPEDRDAVVAWLGRERDARGLRTSAEALAALAGENAA